MKLSIIIYSWAKKAGLLIITLFFSALSLTAQDQRTAKTKIADVLATLPTNSNPDAERAFTELLSTGEAGLSMVCEQVVPNGSAAGVAPRYAVSLLTHYAKTTVDKALIEKAYLQALGKASDAEVKAYFISNIQLVGSNAGVKSLSAYISNADLYAPAIAALVTLGTPEARLAIMTALKGASPAVQNRLIEALGELKHKAAIPAILPFAASSDVGLQKQALWALALMGDAASYTPLFNKAKATGFKNDPTEASNALVEYLHQLQVIRNTALVSKLSLDILAGTTAETQQHFRLAALKGLAWANAATASKTQIAELKRFDDVYRREVLKIAATGLKNPAVKLQWENAYKLEKGAVKADILAMLAASSTDAVFIEKQLLPALKSSESAIRTVAAAAIARSKNKKYAGNLLDYLLKAADEPEAKSAQMALLQLIDKDNVSLVAAKLGATSPSGQIALIQVLAERRAVAHFDEVAARCKSTEATVQTAAFQALPNLASSKKMPELREAVRPLLKIRQNPAMASYHDRAFTAIIAQINKASWSDEQKLALLQDAMLSANSKADKIAVIRSMGRLRGLPALMSVNRFHDNPDLSATVSRSIMQIALPTADAKPGLTGSTVRSALERARATLSGPDSQYERIDIETYLATLPASSTEVSKPYVLTAAEQQEGFEILFNGKDLNSWVGNKTDYVVEDNNIAIYPTATQNRGNLYTANEYSDFIFRFEFQLTPGANNGLGIHAPLEGDAAYVGKEIQILDNTSPIYAKLEQYQYHGSVYGVMPAKRDFLKPVGEWNQEEVYVKGNFIRVTLNGTVILEGDMKEASKNGTLDHKDHPGLNRNKGHIGFLGHGSVLKFRNIRIKDMAK
ncbi:MAG: DUF1080 domain-containing protein [Haliscomenobacter sp.]|nr:DUF1080 domain-containing protein [Haliscomenobacter sp.]MBK9491642.1 DUF1080 domain-containing protein [Haliscomenobacter sp.]